ncbi:hypothetical protein [Deinococcus sp.]|uniref:hypothetical protein n=1 Tax=Deinococcus sp. TaxID=47478 RepID=UPI00286DF87E|nr:hypothetical protein [Deinococcus sp.]
MRLILTLACSVSALAAQPVLKPLSLSAACRIAGYSALQDAAGTLRVLRYVRLVPDNSARVTQYYGASGRLQSVRATASGFAGVLYDLAASVDAKGNVVNEKGYRSKLFTDSLKTAIRDAAAVRAGRCVL